MKRTLLGIASAALWATTLPELTAQDSLPTVSKPEDYALKHATPPYPDSARAHFVTGSGIFEVQVDRASGRVVDVAVVKTTGSKLLDRSAVETLHHWVFRPNSVLSAKIPITFTYTPRH